MNCYLWLAAVLSVYSPPQPNRACHLPILNKLSFLLWAVTEVWQEAVEADRHIAILGHYRPEQGNYRFFQARIKDFVSKNTKLDKVTV